MARKKTTVGEASRIVSGNPRSTYNPMTSGSGYDTKAVSGGRNNPRDPAVREATRNGTYERSTPNIFSAAQRKKNKR